MTGLAAACLVLAALAVWWPAPGARARYRRLLAGPARPRSRWSGLGLGLGLGAGVGLVGWAAAVPPRVRVAVGITALTAFAAVLGGAVAAAVAGSYGVAAGLALARHERERAWASSRASLVEAIGNATADLRAGLAAGTALAGLTGPGPGLAYVTGPDPALAGATGPDGAAGGAVDGPGRAHDRRGRVRPEDPAVAQLAEQVRAAVRLAEHTGAPLAELLERIEADARAGDRARSAATAQAAGSRATAWLLAALPAGGIALGYAIGADPLAVLLHTPAGAACAFGAVVLQLGGLVWTRRIARPGPAVAP